MLERLEKLLLIRQGERNNVLYFLFFFMLTPVGLFFRLTGKDPLHRRFDPEASSYWTDPRPRRGKESYFRQF